MRRFVLAALAVITANPLPAAPPSKLRYENITDIEVREIQAVMAGRIPGAIVNIGGVTDGCDCQEGPDCTNQVWVVSHQPGKEAGVYLSKIDGHWGIGPYEKWQDQLDALRDKRSALPPAHSLVDWSTQFEAEKRLLAAMPKCSKPSPNRADTGTARKADAASAK